MMNPKTHKILFYVLFATFTAFVAMLVAPPSFLIPKSCCDSSAPGFCGLLAGAILCLIALRFLRNHRERGSKPMLPVIGILGMSLGLFLNGFMIWISLPLLWTGVRDMGWFAGFGLAAIYAFLLAGSVSFLALFVDEKKTCGVIGLILPWGVIQLGLAVCWLSTAPTLLD